MEKEITLQRDTCEQCLKLKKEGRKNSLGKQIYCSQGHAQELSNIRRSQAVSNLKKEIFDTIYQWGRAGVVVDENSPVIKKMLDDLEETWY
jgi:hypothetical protein